VKPVIAISMGDPGGIGPEVIVKALGDDALQRSACFVLFGLSSCLRKAAEAAGIQAYWRSVPSLRDISIGEGLTIVESEEDPGPFEPRDTPLGGRLSLRWVEAAVNLAKGLSGPRADAIVTGPISKAAWSMAGERTHRGHTGLLGARFGVEHVAMMFHCPMMNVVLATDHRALRDVPAALTPALVERSITLGKRGCEQMGIERPRIAVCGVNPHAGEGGLMGSEEDDVIKPAIKAARSRGIDAHGPFSGDTIFRDAIDWPDRPRKYDLVVAMYHDQGLIPVKLLARDSAVNVTIGLPVVRTSPDHGTAFDIAGRNLADAGSMKAALALAVTMARRRGQPRESGESVAMKP
jgi:4-hydroxythreonine-4-phosphate dehydrogenase